ncbi:MAG: insulinase family protein [Alphaproteobacteria bacterium]|nr:insulinase family protein [Alphaproteobacteria bacterium]
MMRRLSAFFAAILVAGMAWTAPAAAADIKPIDLGKKVEVWFAEDHTVPIVSFNISMPAGSAYDPAGKAGLATFAASLMDEGAGNLNSKAFHEALADRAIRFSARTDRDWLVISVTSLTRNVPEAMRLLQMALTRPRFDADAVTRVRAQFIQSLEQEQAEPDRMAARTFMRDFFNGHPYGHSTIGNIADIKAISVQDIRDFAKAHWVKSGMKIAVAGDITQADAAKLLGSTFLPVSGASVPAERNVGKLGRPGVHVVPMPVPQATAVFGLPGIMRQDPDFIPGYVANYILGGGGFSSRLMTEVREKRGLTYGVSTSLSSMNKASVMVGSVATRADAVRQTVQVVRETMAKFAQDGPTQQELDDAKTYLTGSFPLAFASNSGTATQMGAFQRQNLDIGYIARRNGLINAVTLSDVKRVAKRLFDPARMTVVIGGSPVDAGKAPVQGKPPVRPAPEKPGMPPKPVDKPAPGPVTQPSPATAPAKSP